MKEFIEVFIHPIGDFFGICYADKIASDKLCFLAIRYEESENFSP
jgi:hypothetical protein